MRNGFLIFLLTCNIAAAEPLKVAIIDTGLDLRDSRFSSVLCSGGSKDFTGQGIEDVSGHGTHIAGLIKKYAENSNYCLLIYKYFLDTDFRDNTIREVDALDQAIHDGAKIINISGGGYVPELEEEMIIAMHPEVTFVAAAGNDGKNLNIYSNKHYPASYKYSNVIAVGSTHLKSNYAPWVVWEDGNMVYSTLPNGQNGYMSGTSQATAIHTGKLIKGYKK